MISAILTQIGLPIMIRVLRDTLKNVNHPSAQGAANALNDVSQALIGGTIPNDQLAQAQQDYQSHIQKMAELESAHLQTAMQEINASLRAEIISQDMYVRRMRPTFGYLMAITWAAQMLALAYVIVVKTEHAGLVLQAMGSLGAIWAVGLSVLGIYVYKRSEDKKLNDNITNNLTSSLASRLFTPQSQAPKQNIPAPAASQAIQPTTTTENGFNS